MQPRQLSDEQARELAPAVRRLIGAKFRSVPDHVASHDDLFQYAMLGIIRAAPRFDAAHGMSFRTWALTKAHYAVQDALRTLTLGPRGREALQVVSLDEPVAGVDDVTRADLIADGFEFADPLLARALEVALGTLSLDQQSAVALRFDEDLNLGEIADMMGVTESRVSQLVTTALVKLRAHPALAA